MSFFRNSTSRWLRGVGSFFLLAPLLAAGACGDDSDRNNVSASCIPGETRACLGIARCAGTQVCNADGKSLSVCECGPSTTGSGGSGPASAGEAGSAGESGSSVSSGGSAGDAGNGGSLGSLQGGRADGSGGDSGGGNNPGGETSGLGGRGSGGSSEPSPVTGGAAGEQGEGGAGEGVIGASPLEHDWSYGFGKTQASELDVLSNDHIVLLGTQGFEEPPVASFSGPFLMERASDGKFLRGYSLGDISDAQNISVQSDGSALIYGYAGGTTADWPCPGPLSQIGAYSVSRIDNTGKCQGMILQSPNSNLTGSSILGRTDGRLVVWSHGSSLGVYESDFQKLTWGFNPPVSLAAIMPNQDVVVVGQAAPGQMHLARLAADTGEVLWRSFFTVNLSLALRLRVGPDRIWLTGLAKPTSDFGDQVAPGAVTDPDVPFVAAFTIEGRLAFSSFLTSTPLSNGTRPVVAPQPAGGALICVGYANVLSVQGHQFDASAPSGTTDVLMARFTSEGALDWAGSWPLPGNQYCADVAVDSTNAPIVAGGYQGALDLGGGSLPMASSGWSTYVVKFKSLPR